MLNTGYYHQKKGFTALRTLSLMFWRVINVGHCSGDTEGEVGGWVEAALRAMASLWSSPGDGQNLQSGEKRGSCVLLAPMQLQVIFE